MNRPYPRAWLDAHCFSFFNAVSFQIMMGAPIILFAKSLGASSTVLGVIAAFTPLMTVFQLPAAHFLDRFGYREFVLMGWASRTVLIFAVAAIPVLGFLDAADKLAVLLALLFVFNLLRGIASAAWMPWIAELIPQDVRGRFISNDHIFIHVGCLLSLAISALVTTGSVSAWEYAAVFLLSAVGASLSLVFLRRIPEVATPELARRSGARVPWMAMLGFEPFRRLLGFNLLMMLVTGSLGVFTVEFLRGTVGLSASSVLALSAASFAGALVALPVAGAVIDRTGSKPIMRLAVAALGLVIGGWFAVASNLLPATHATIAALNVGAGAAGSVYGMANGRAVFAAVPEMGRNHFFALFTVLTSATLGISPITWGLALDVLGSFEAVTGALVWKRHSLYFLALFLLNLAAVWMVSRLIETRTTADDDARGPADPMAAP